MKLVPKPEDLGEKALTEVLSDVAQLLESVPPHVNLDNNVSYHQLHDDADQLMRVKVWWSNPKGSITIHQVSVFDSEEEWDNEILGAKE